MTPTVPPMTPSADPPRRLTRSSTDRVFAGVAGGLGRHFDLDPVLFRIGFAVLALFGGSGLLLYLLLALLVPIDDPESPYAHRSTTRTVLMVGAVAILLASLPFAGHGALFIGPGLVFCAALIAVGVLIWRAAGGTGVDNTVLRAAIIVVVLVVAAMAGVGAAIAAALGAGTGLAIGVIALGVALIVAAFLGGARWLIVPALLVAIPLAIVSASGLDLKGGVGQRDYRPASVEDLNSNYRLGVGELRLDLSDVVLPPGTTDLNVKVGVGHAIVTVPSDVCVQPDVHIGAGDSLIVGRDDNGVDVNVTRHPQAAEGAATLHLNGKVGLGQLEVRGSRAACAS